MSLGLNMFIMLCRQPHGVLLYSTGYMPTVKNSAIVDEAYINRMRRGERGGELMDQTFPRRRQEIGSSRGRRNKSIVQLRDTYPALFEAKEVCVIILKLN